MKHNSADRRAKRSRVIDFFRPERLWTQWAIRIDGLLWRGLINLDCGVFVLNYVECPYCSAPIESLTAEDATAHWVCTSFNSSCRRPIRTFSNVAAMDAYFDSVWKNLKRAYQDRVKDRVERNRCA
jgi:hypothetical protein